MSHLRGDEGWVFSHHFHWKELLLGHYIFSLLSFPFVDSVYLGCQKTPQSYMLRVESFWIHVQGTSKYWYVKEFWQIHIISFFITIWCNILFIFLLSQIKHKHIEKKDIWLLLYHQSLEQFKLFVRFSQIFRWMNKIRVRIHIFRFSNLISS